MRATSIALATILVAASTAALSEALPPGTTMHQMQAGARTADEYFAKLRDGNDWDSAESVTPLSFNGFQAVAIANGADAMTRAAHCSRYT